MERRTITFFVRISHQDSFINTLHDDVSILKILIKN